MKTKSDSYICKDYDGNIFVSCERFDEMLLSENPLLTHCLAVVKIGDNYLLSLRDISPDRGITRVSARGQGQALPLQ